MHWWQIPAKTFGSFDHFMLRQFPVISLVNIAIHGDLDQKYKSNILSVFHFGTEKDIDKLQF